MPYIDFIFPLVFPLKVPLLPGSLGQRHNLPALLLPHHHFLLCFDKILNVNLQVDVPDLVQMLLVLDHFLPPSADNISLSVFADTWIKEMKE